MGWTAVLLILAVGTPLVINQSRLLNGGAELYFLENTRAYVIGEQIQVELRVRTNGKRINTMGFRLSIDPQYLDIVKMTTDNSFCTLYTENTFNQRTGEVSVSCGVPNPGFSGDSLAVRLDLRSKVPGTIPITVQEGSTMLLANDGRGSILGSNAPSTSVTVQPL
jgi:hypothetical protein